MITGIVSSGRRGADLAALLTGQALGLKIGGYAPKTSAKLNLTGLDGDCHHEMNVMMADGLLVLGNQGLQSLRLEALTLECQKPVLWLKEYQSSTAAPRFRMWVLRHKITVLLVTGNMEVESPGIGTAVEAFLTTTLPELM